MIPNPVEQLITTAQSSLARGCSVGEDCESGTARVPIHNPERIAPAIIAPDRTSLGQCVIALSAIRPQA